MSLWSHFSSQKGRKAKSKLADETKKKKKRRTLPKRISREDAARLLAQPDIATWRGLRDHCMLLMMYRAGLRVSEVVALRPEDVEVTDEGVGTVHVWQGKGGVDRTSYFDPAVVMPALSEWLAHRVELDFTADQPLFCAARGKQLTTRSVQLMVADSRRRAGITARCTPHTLRHTFASELIEDGFATVEVQELLGHASVATTEIYARVAAGRLAAKVRDRRAVG